MMWRMSGVRLNSTISHWRYYGSGGIEEELQDVIDFKAGFVLGISPSQRPDHTEYRDRRYVSRGS